MILALGDHRPAFEGGDHFIADDATVIGNVVLGDACSVWFGAVLRADNDRIVIGARSNIQDTAILHTDPGIELVVGREVTIGHRAALHGCKVGDRTLIGIGSTVLNGACIGSDCIVGAHALVTEHKAFPDGVLITGTPARVARPLTETEIGDLPRLADVYVDNARRYRETLRPAAR